MTAVTVYRVTDEEPQSFNEVGIRYYQPGDTVDPGVQRAPSPVASQPCGAGTADTSEMKIWAPGSAPDVDEQWHRAGGTLQGGNTVVRNQ